MKKIILYIFCFFNIWRACSQNDSVCLQDNNFKLILELSYVDFNYSFINNIDSCFWTDEIENIIQPKGEYSIYVFKRNTIGLSKLGFQEEFVECIFQKIDNNIVLESIYIPLTWREPPISSVVLFSTNTITISDSVPIRNILFHNINETGIDVLNKQGYLIYKDVR